MQTSRLDRPASESSEYLLVLGEGSRESGGECEDHLWVVRGRPVGYEDLLDTSQVIRGSRDGGRAPGRRKAGDNLGLSTNPVRELDGAMGRLIPGIPGQGFAGCREHRRRTRGVDRLHFVGAGDESQGGSLVRTGGERHPTPKEAGVCKQQGIVGDLDLHEPTIGEFRTPRVPPRTRREETSMIPRGANRGERRRGVEQLCRRSMSTPVLHRDRCGDELGCDRFIWLDGRSRQVPCTAFARQLIPFEGACEIGVCGASCGSGSRLIRGRPDERVWEYEMAASQLHETQLLAFLETVRDRLVRLGDYSHRVGVRRGRDQQGVSRCIGQRLQATQDRAFVHVADRQGTDDEFGARQLRFAEQEGGLQERSRVPSRCLHQPRCDRRCHASAEPVRHELQRRRLVQAADGDALEAVAVEPMRGVILRREEQDDRFGLESARGEPQGVGGCRIEPVRIIDDAEQRLIGRGGAKEREHRGAEVETPGARRVP